MTSSALDRVDLDVTDPSVRTGHHPAGKVEDDVLPCRSHDPELWFAESPAQLDVAKALCRACPVQRLCLQGALERREPWGVWGAELFQQGVVIAHKRGRGRPRKDEVRPGSEVPPAPAVAGRGPAAQTVAAARA